jgi:hypothetical protein
MSNSQDDDTLIPAWTRLGNAVSYMERRPFATVAEPTLKLPTIWATNAAGRK